MKIAIDAAGGDYAPREIVKGLWKPQPGRILEIVLLGDGPAIEELLPGEKSAAGITVVHTPQQITCNENPVQAVRSKPGSAIVRGIDMVKTGGAAAFVSAGNTGAVLAASYFNLRTLEGIERPALGVMIPIGRPFLLIDGGANTDCQARFSRTVRTDRRHLRPPLHGQLHRPHRAAQ